MVEESMILVRQVISNTLRTKFCYLINTSFVIPLIPLWFPQSITKILRWSFYYVYLAIWSKLKRIDNFFILKVFDNQIGF